MCSQQLFTFWRGLRSIKKKKSVGGGCQRWQQPGYELLGGAGFQLSGFGFWVSGSGFRVPGFGSRVSGFGFKVSGFGFRVSGFRSRVSRFGSRVSGLGFRVSGFELRDCRRRRARVCSPKGSQRAASNHAGLPPARRPWWPPTQKTSKEFRKYPISELFVHPTLGNTVGT